MSESSTSSSGAFLFTSLFYGLSACGFAVIVFDLLSRIPGLQRILQPIHDRFFPVVEDGFGLLVTSLVLFGVGALGSYLSKKAG